MVSYLQVEKVTKSFGDLVLFENISFGVGEGQHIALIAKNGAGKSTLLSIIAGKQQADSGAVSMMRDLRIAYLDQEPVFPKGMTTLQACFYSENPTLKAIAEYELALEADDIDRLQSAMTDMDTLGAWDYEQRAKQILSRLKINHYDKVIDNMSGGELKRIALARVLISEADLIILDEPTNHLDMDMIDWLEQYLSSTRAALLMVTHDRYFLDRVCSDIIEIDGLNTYGYKGNYSYYLEKRQERVVADNARRETEMNLYKRELDWVRRQPQARATKAKSRVDAFYDLEDRVKSTNNSESIQLDVKSTRVGGKIFEVKNLSKSFGDLTILDNFNYTFQRLDKLGIVGNNGCGKSTFLKLLMNEIAPDGGVIEIGESIKFGYYSQTGLKFDGKMKVIDVITAIAEQVDLGDGRMMSASQFLQHFLFSPTTQHNFVARLSGGERRRLYLCTILMQMPNFLILDEPTNDLDIITLGVLEEYLRNYKGCLMVVSHDRYFMDRVVDHLLIFAGDGHIKEFAGNYTDYIDWKSAYEAQKRELELKAKPKAETKIKTIVPVKKLSFKEKREFEALEIEIAALEAEKSELEVKMSSGTVDVGELTTMANRISEIIDQIDDKSMRWLELSELA